jgi:hypothetical protein
MATSRNMRRNRLPKAHRADKAALGPASNLLDIIPAEGCIGIDEIHTVIAIRANQEAAHSFSVLLSMKNELAPPWISSADCWPGVRRPFTRRVFKLKHMVERGPFLALRCRAGICAPITLHGVPNRPRAGLFRTRRLSSRALGI